ncbi:unnamed protein product [Rotaria socialis]|uniref:PDZ domain-containing protein n=1 Tax=Rotaria socialis TaxID=392032 RepID=A0A820SIU9_9BILA|nr:unnamed protein product [Rotaria socialis]
MSKVFISRQDGSVSWGFRLQGGLEYNEPLTVINIVPDSPADGKLDPGDMIMEIAGNNVTNISHRDALELIQRCANALFLTVHKVGYSYPVGVASPRPAPIAATWRPAGQQQQQQQQQPYYPQNFQQQQQPPVPYYQQNFQQQQPYYQQNFQQPSNYQQQPNYQHGFQQQQHQHSDQMPPPPPSLPPPMPLVNVPRAPIFDADLIANAAASLKSRPIDESPTSSENTTETANIPAILAKSLSRPGGPKPFTYTPGGLDLSKIRESARVRRHREYTSNTEEPNETQESDPNMSRRMIVPPENISQHHYVPQNPSQPFNQARQQPTPAKKHIQHDADVVTQSRSFQMLQGWISDSEKTVPTAVAPPSQSTSAATATTTTAVTNKSAVARAVLDEQMGNNDRGTNYNNTSGLPSRSFRYLQEQYNTSNGDNNKETTVEETPISAERLGLRRGSGSHMPSRAFKILQDQCDSQQGPINRSGAVNNREDLMEIYNKPPPSFREREPEAPRYTGATVPSRSFRFLQMMTQNDEQNDSKPLTGYNKPQQVPNKYDEQNLSFSTNKIDTHPSRSFKYLQEMTGGQQSPTTVIETG